MSTTPDQDLLRAQSENMLETSRSTLEQTEAVELFQKQLVLLKKRLLEPACNPYRGHG